VALLLRQTNKARKARTMTNENRDISNMTSSEVTQLIFGDAQPWEHVAMPEWIAREVINNEHFDRPLKDWAWLTLGLLIDQD